MKKGMNIFLSVLFGILLTVSAVLFILLLFIHALGENVRIPSVGALSGRWLTDFFDSWLPIIFGGVLLLIPMLILILINIHRIRRAFITIGISTAVAAVFSAAAGLACARIIKKLSGEWQEVLVNTTVVFKEFSTVCAVILVVFGAACISIYSCIAAAKGDKHEKGV